MSLSGPHFLQGNETSTGLRVAVGRTLRVSAVVDGPAWELAYLKQKHYQMTDTAP